MFKKYHIIRLKLRQLLNDLKNCEEHHVTKSLVCLRIKQILNGREIGGKDE